MRRLKIFLALAILIGASQTCFAQENEKLEPFDSFGETSCEDVLGRLDNFFVAVRNNPAAIGYIIISGKKDDRKILQFERIIHSGIEFRRFDDSNLSIVRADSQENLFVQFWLVQPGAEKPVYVETKLDLTISENKKPYIFNSTEDDTGACPVGSQLKLYADYLATNPKARGNIVIFDKSRAEFLKTKTYLSNELVSKYKIPPAQMSFFFVKSKDSVYNEFWLVPRRKQN